ncbi:glyceraldehyde-3-phosphate dehydrogenase [Roseibium sp. TrichSKD4]|uniref:type I glyceraldehyde-3-phosphate dehydrogenase n=1 Tax=Roseibium sp. TrichSKD4 TaxID=744980 RepID=UPI0001E576B4|nr:glyceraldehyde 3-phosphate dehydrogenase NAD-binding domain-containing protein [Roseibium sp. TrichSKD4]EFO30061.1 glyceraldehyde-3-phosphate dehydrogenase [Roseibium sp. TrichSKD4]
MHLLINGFGRIGRTVLRQLLALPADRKPKSIWLNDIAGLETALYLFKYDSVFGPYPGSVEASADGFVINGQRVSFTSEPDISILDLSQIDLVMECTGKAQTREIAERGLKSGARQVLISGPSLAANRTLVLGANADNLGDEKIVSNASCTTNALAPLLKGLDDRLEIEHGHMTTIHCYTGSQPMVDAPRGALERSRAGAVSMVPTTTSAARLIAEILPNLNGRMTASAVRVPTISVSAVDLTVTVKKELPTNINSWLQGTYSKSKVVGFTHDPVVSTDMRARPESLIIALPETMQSGRHQLRLFGWYDNEWGFSARMIEMAEKMITR